MKTCLGHGVHYRKWIHSLHMYLYNFLKRYFLSKYALTIIITFLMRIKKKKMAIGFHAVPQPAAVPINPIFLCSTSQVRPQSSYIPKFLL